MSYRRKHINPKIRGLKKKKKLFQRPVFWILLLVAVAGGTGIYAILFLPQIQVVDIQVAGNARIQTQEIQAAARDRITKYLFGFPYNSLLMASTQDISRHILDSFSMVESAIVEKKIPNEILINITERRSYAVFCTDTSICFSIDESGVIFGEPHDPGPDDFLVQASGDFSKSQPGDTVVNKNIMEGIVKIQKNLKDEFSINTKRVDVLQTLVFTTGEGWRAYFDPNQNIQLQITKMDILLKDQISEAVRKKLQYIYLQYKDRAYYK